MTTVALIGTMDTKGAEYAWIAERLGEASVEVIVIDVGTFSDAVVDVTAADVARAAGDDLDALRASGDRGAAMTAMATGAAVVTARLFEERRLHGVLAVGGSGGSSVAAQAMRGLPIGVPKVLVSTMASGDMGPYVGEADLTVMHSVVDVAGINSISELIFGNAVAAVAAMARAYGERAGAVVDAADRPPLVGVTMFGLTTPCVDEARATLQGLGYEVLVFHATGAGGRAFEKLAGEGHFAGVLDLTTTELADDLVGGVLSAGPHRLEAAGRVGIPQIVSLGALDMVNFGPRASVPEAFAGRKFVEHNPTVTLMRTDAEESAELGQRIGRKLAQAQGAVEVWLPLRGVSGIDIDGGVFHDRDADAALYSSIADAVAGSEVALVQIDAHINDTGFGRDAALRLHELIEKPTRR